jgi:3-oxoacyl-[acyl-carrier protein] reductase
MMKQKSGRIISLSSVVGEIGNAGQVNYAAAKAGVIGMTKSLARELGRRHVTCNAVAPGFIATDMTKDLPADIVAQMQAQIPLGEFGEAEDVAQAIVFLASDQARYITGQVINVDGGMVM